jgi:hypothetical protein
MERIVALPRWADFIIDTSGWQQLEWRSMTFSEGTGGPLADLSLTDVF